MQYTKLRRSRSIGSRGVFFKGFTIYGHGSHLGHVTSISLIIFHFLYLKAQIQNLVKCFLRKTRFDFHILMRLGQGREVTLALRNHIHSLPQLFVWVYQHSGHRLQ